MAIWSSEASEKSFVLVSIQTLFLGQKRSPSNALTKVNCIRIVMVNSLRESRGSRNITDEFKPLQAP
jgi:hypothetical protein